MPPFRNFAFSWLLVGTTLASDPGERFFHLPRDILSSSPPIVNAVASSGAVISADPVNGISRDPWGDNVNVRWSGIPSAGSDDVIALFCPLPQEIADAFPKSSSDQTSAPRAVTFSNARRAVHRDDVYGTVQVGFSAADALDTFPVTACDGWATGSCAGGIPVRLFDMRTTCSFAYVNSSGSVLAVSDAVTWPDQGTPTQVHMMTVQPDGPYGTTVTRVTFTTAKVPAASSGTLLYRRIGGEGGAVSSVATTTSTYSASDLCTAPANVTGQQFFRDPGLFHSADMRLEPGAMYEYSVATGAGRTPWKKISGGPVQGDSSPVTVALVADMGTFGFPAFWSMPGANATIKRIVDDVDRGLVSAVVHAGDISYAVSHGYLWDQFMQNIGLLTSRVPCNYGLGNHEYDGPLSYGWHPEWFDGDNDSHGECGVPTIHRFPQFPSLERPWYSFSHGHVLFIMMSSEHNFTRNSEQYNWIESTLATVDRAKTPFVILTAHRPMYTSQLGAEPDHVFSLHFRTEMDALINKYSVDLMVSGHYHSMELSCPVENDVCHPPGTKTVHAVIGTAGAVLEEGAFPGKWSVKHFIEFGYVRLTTTPETLVFNFVSTATGESLYEFKIAAKN